MAGQSYGGRAGITRLRKDTSNTVILNVQLIWTVVMAGNRLLPPGSGHSRRRGVKMAGEAPPSVQVNAGRPSRNYPRKV